MRIIDGTVVASASDLVLASNCEYAVLRRVDAVRGLGDPLPDETDSLMARAGELGLDHERRLLAGMAGVTTIGDHHNVAQAAEATLAAIASGAPVIAQGLFFDGRLLGIADFLIRQPDGSYLIADAKLARREKPRAVLQIAIYSELAQAAGVAIAAEGALLLGSGQEFRTDIDRIRPVVRDRRQRLEQLMDDHIRDGKPVDWDDPGITICGRCATCAAQVAATHDVLLVAGLRMTQRAKLRKAGIKTIEQLAACEDSIDKMPERTRATLQAQAALQVQQMQSATGDESPAVSYDLYDPAALGAIPTPNPGDIFFDFEGDPMWQDPATGDWGLEYLFGVVEAPVNGGAPEFRPFWAHDRRQEAKALQDFLQYVADRRSRYPDMHIYHYADYERAALLRLAVRHGVGEDEVDDLLRQHVLIDLYPIVRRSLRISQPSYSIKKLEPLYMGDRLREGDVTTAGDSVVEYAIYCDERDAGQSTAADQRLAAIADYNEYDCVSTLELRDWLLGMAADAGVAPADLEPLGDGGKDSAAADEELLQPLLDFAAPAPGRPRTAEQTAVALVAAAVGFHRREAKPYWWQHYERLGAAIDEIEDRDAMKVQDAVVDADWHKRPRSRKPRRVLRLRGQLEPGSGIKRGKGFLLYEAPHPEHLSDGGPETRGYREVDIDEVTVDADGYDCVLVTELTENDCEYDDLPTIITAGPGPHPGPVRTALQDIARDVAARLSSKAGDRVPGPACDLLLRRPPRLMPGETGLPPVVDTDFIAAITSAVRALDGSALSVQGPPGTGKTYVGGHVIAALMAEGWRIGVVSQGHAAIDHLLDGVVKAGGDPARVGKKNRPAGSVWREVPTSDYATFLRPGGCVIGGTAWDFTCEDRVARGQLDLLVIDEAGQYSLANTLAVSVAAKRLLLLGDPQQLPQVSQGSHPEPVGDSALGWLSEDHTLPAEYGYFLDRTWRMHPKVTEAVSALSYDGRLRSLAAVTAARTIRDASGKPVEPGVFWRPVQHRDNTVSSLEEAAVVADLVAEALTWTWQDPACDAAPRPMTPTDILVVTPFNAQRALVDAELVKRGISEIRVGTVDKFQGQEAPLTILSMSASSPAEVPRGMTFLMSPNRLNVAVSRAQYRSVVVSSPALSNYLPGSIDGLGELGGYLGLIGG